jgi:carbon-monoxide dehydrogenase large subunit
MIGTSQPVYRREDIRFVTGTGCFADDINVPHQAYAFFVRSTHAHGVLRSVNDARAKSMSGVLGVFTGKDIHAAGIGPIPYLPIPGFPMDMPIDTPRPVLAFDRVRYVGEQVAVVVAETLTQAIDAAEQVGIDIEDLPAVVDIKRAIRPGAPVLWPLAPDNVVLSWHFGDTAKVDAAFARAAHVTRLKLVNNRVLANPLESRTSIAFYDASTGRYEITVSSQGVLYFLRGLCEHTLRVSPDKMHVRTYDVGGAFGTKELPYPEDVAILYAARILGRPVKWTGTRSEQFLSDNHARNAVIDCAVALDQEANFLAVRATVLNAMGAYCSYIAPIMPIRNTTNGLPLLYKTPLVEVSQKMVVTNSAPIGPYRGAGREQGALIVESLVDEAARQIGIDRIVLRRRNVLPNSAIPYSTPTGRVYDSGDFECVLNKALNLADWYGFDARARTSRSAGKIRGRGISFFIESVGGIPFEGAHIRFGDDGTVSVVLATQSQGQGHETSFSQIVADQLGIPFDSIRICQGNSFDVPRGMGSFASRSMIMAGSAIKRTCDLVIEKGRQLAAHLLEVSKDDIEFSAGMFRVAGTDIAIGVRELAARVRALANLTHNLPQSLDSSGEFAVKDFHFPNGCHICEIEIDPDTGLIEVARYNVMADFGVIINPTIVRGQLHGGVAQGLGQALFERCVYDGCGQLVTGSFMDYAMPRASDFPEPKAEFHEVPSTANPLGVKGCGEAGTTGSIPAIYNAVADAFSRANVNTMIDMPFTPEKVWRAINLSKGAIKIHNGAAS